MHAYQCISRRIQQTQHRLKQALRLFSQVKEAVQLDILVENMGRVNYGLDMDRQRKGDVVTLKQPDFLGEGGNF